MSPPSDGLWVGRGEVCELLGVGKRKLARMAAEGRIKTRRIGSHCQYSREDVRAVIEDGRSMPLMVNPDGESINLKGRIADWVNECFLGRLDSCWVFMTAHAYLDREESERVRDRIVADIARAGSTRVYRCVAAPAMAPLPNEYKRGPK